MEGHNREAVGGETRRTVPDRQTATILPMARRPEGAIIQAYQNARELYSMPASVPLEDLERANEELQGLEMKFPEASDDFAEFFRRNRNIGYNNLCKLLMGEKTPKELKGIDEDEDEDGDGNEDEDDAIDGATP